MTRSTAQAILCIDQGTSATKAVVIDAVDGVLGLAEVPVRVTFGADGSAELDPHQIWDSVVAAGRAALTRAGRPVDAVALANQGETVLAWDRTTGLPQSPAVSWQDRRSGLLVDKLYDARRWVRQRTGLALDPYFSAPKMAWLRRAFPAAGVITTSDCWLLHRLCGAFVTDASTASRSLLSGLDRVSWDPELQRLFGLTDEPLPTIVGCDSVLGMTSTFGPTVPVAGVMVDQAAALLGHGCVQRGAAKCTFGTGAFLLTQLGEHAVRSTSGLTTSVAWQLRARTAYCLDGPVYAAGSLVNWLRRLGLVTKAASIDDVATETTQGVLCVPAVLGLAAPWWRRDATATFTGLTVTTDASHLVLAAMQGLAAQLAELVDLVRADIGERLDRLAVDGGLTGCRTLMQATADILQLPVDLCPLGNAAALGVAGASRMALAPELDLADITASPAPIRTYEPSWAPDQAAAFRARWRSAVEALVLERSP
jgi:glycerol kinase